MTTISITNARKNLTSLIDKVSGSQEKIIITKNGRPKAILMGVDEFEGWRETLEIMGDKELMKQIRRGEEDINKGRVAPLDEVFK